MCGRISVAETRLEKQLDSNDFTTTYERAGVAQRAANLRRKLGLHDMSAADALLVRELGRLERQIEEHDYSSPDAYERAANRVREIRDQLGLATEAESSQQLNLIPYDSAHILMSPDMAQAAADMIEALQLGRNETLMWDSIGDAYYVVVDTGSEQRVVPMEEWATWLFIGKDPSITAFDPAFDPNPQFEQLNNGYWAVTWPDGSTEIVTTEQRAMIEYMLAQGYDPSVMPDFANADHWGEWRPHEPTSMLGSVHAFLDIVGFAPVVRYTCRCARRHCLSILSSFDT